MTFGASTGLVAITSYSLYSDNGSGDGVFNEIATGLITSYLVTGLTGGQTYKFKVRATNMYGAGAYSSELSYVPMDYPSKVGIPTVTLPLTTSTSVTIDWDAPNDHSSTITAYDIKFLTSTGLYVSVSSCSGSDSTIKTNTAC